MLGGVVQLVKLAVLYLDRSLPSLYVSHRVISPSSVEMVVPLRRLKPSFIYKL
jgi:hypothetical protein